MTYRTTFVICSLIPNLNDLSGHDYIYHLSVQSAAAKIEIEHTAFVPHDCLIEDLPETWEPLFHSKTNPYSVFKRFIFRCLEFRKLFRTSAEKKRVFFLESFTTIDYIALVFASLLFAKKKDVLWLLFRYDLKLLKSKGFLHSFFFKLLKLKQKNRLIVSTDSELIASSLQTKIKHKIHVMPIPHTEIISQTFQNEKKSSYLCWWPGRPKMAKGLKEIQTLLSLCDISSSQIEIVLSEKTPLPSSSLSVKIEQIANALTREDYLNWLGKSDVILLPYDPLIYESSTSGIFVEAISAGKMVLVKKGSWLAHELKKHDLGELVVDWADPLFFSHLLSLFRDDRVKKKLQTMQLSYQKFHSLNGFSQKMKEMLFS